MTIMSNAKDAAEHATDAIKDTGASAKSSLLDVGVQLMRLFNDARAMESRGVESLLGRVGLQRQQSAAVPVLWFAAGAAVATGATLLLAPTSGAELRKKLSGMLSSVEKSASKELQEIETSIGSALHPVAKKTEVDGHRAAAPNTPAKS